MLVEHTERKVDPDQPTPPPASPSPSPQLWVISQLHVREEEEEGETDERMDMQTGRSGIRLHVRR